MCEEVAYEMGCKLKSLRTYDLKKTSEHLSAYYVRTFYHQLIKA